MSRHWHWAPPGRPVRVAGHTIPGGLIYVGQHLRSAGGGVEPALVDPDLPVAWHQSPRWYQDESPPRTPAYHLLSPAGRAAYLAWLAGGRRGTDAPAHVASLFLSLFLAGLERRVLLDGAGAEGAGADGAGGAADAVVAPIAAEVRRELAAITAELRRLRTAYGPTDDCFHARASAFLDVVELLAAPGPGSASGTGARAGGSGPTREPPAPGDDRWPVPMALRTGLARFAAAGVPLPAGWAQSWAWYHPSMSPRTPQRRCPREFDRLFALRYAQRFGPGLVVRPTAAPTRLDYQPVNAGIDTRTVCRPDLPDVLAEPMATRELGRLVDSVTEVLTPYSRWLGRHPVGRGSLAATALLPDELLDRAAGPLRALLDWADAHLDRQGSAVVRAEELGAFWATADPARMSAEEAGGLALVLERLGLGIEPDVRFGGPALAPGPAVLFRLGCAGRTDRDCAESAHRDCAENTGRPSDGYPAAVTILHLVAAVAVAGGVAGAVAAGSAGATSGLHPVVAELAEAQELTPAERIRLHARLRWLLAARATLARLERRVTALRGTERETAGHLLVAAATAGTAGAPAPAADGLGGPASVGAPAPAAVAALTRAYRMVGLDPATAYPRLHHLGLDGGRGAPGDRRTAPPAREPVTVRPARPGPAGHALPRTARQDAPSRPATETSDSAAAPAAAPAAAAPRVRVDQHTLAERLAETDTVSALLAGIFTDEGSGEPAVAGVGGPVPGGGDPEPGGDPSGLDGAHGRLLRDLATRRCWSRSDFARLAARHGVLPAGALDVLNEAALDRAGEPVVEGDDDLTVNDDTLRELLG